MKNFKKLRNVLGVSLLFIGAGTPRLFAGWFSGTELETKSMVSVSTAPASPTTILSGTNGNADVLIMLHWSGSGTYPNSEFLLLSNSSTGFSNSASTGTVRIPAGQEPHHFINLGDYRGALYGVVIGTSAAQNVSVIRKK